MTTVSIFNHVLGPIMRGPSSSHTAGAYHIACIARSLLGEAPVRAVLRFDPAGSYAVTYSVQGADRAFALGLVGKPLTDPTFFTALSDVAKSGLDLTFDIAPLAEAEHPNSMEIELATASGRKLKLAARSVGGGRIELVRINGVRVLFTGESYESVISGDAARQAAIENWLVDNTENTPVVDNQPGDRVCWSATRPESWSAAARRALQEVDPSATIWESAPVYFPQHGPPLFDSASGIMQLAAENGWSLGRASVAHEAQLLDMSATEVLDEALRRYDIMVAAAEAGLADDFQGLQLLPACAGNIFRAEADGRLSLRSFATRAAARALAVMHVDAAMGVVCAAPTGGSAGVIPGTLITLAEERQLTRNQIGHALMAAGAVGLVLAVRGTFAAELAGCQVEIGASGAMAAAAVVDAIGGSAAQACDAAAIAFQNTMGTVCDLLHGMVEIPCHTRNGAAAAAAFVNADLILGGYPNLIPLDETIDAVYAVGLAMPSELRCTSKGGLAVTPSALALKPGCCGSGCGTCR